MVRCISLGHSPNSFVVVILLVDVLGILGFYGRFHDLIMRFSVGCIISYPVMY
jgi:hypothetical protein